MAEVVERNEAYEVLRGGDGDAGVFLICEHASNRLPEGWTWPDEDRRLVNQHWAVDLGVRRLTIALADAIGATAVLARFSRLVVDANRPLGSDTLFLQVADGQEVQLNQGLDRAARDDRIERFYRPYHQAVDRALEASPARLVLSMHSFTPVYEGSPPRWMELGILFDQEEVLAHRLLPLVRRHGLVPALNEPYSGKGGLMFSAQSHARRAGRRALEVEIRQDRAVDPAYRDRLVHALAELCGEATAWIDAEHARSE